jgi:hypothetical protein
MGLPVMPVGNATMLCVGGVTRTEAEQARDAGIEIDGHGYYLFLASASEPRQPIQLLAVFGAAGGFLAF